MISKLKYTLLTMLLAAFVAQPALASPLNNGDMAFAFGDSSAVSSDLGEMALLSDQEMKETEGEFWPLIAAYGFLGGYAGGVSYLANTPDPTWAGGLSAVGWGALSGAAGAVGGPGWGLAGVATGSGGYWTSNWGR